MRKEIYIPLIIILLGLIFVSINMMVFLTNGNARLIKNKLKIGAMILSLTGILAFGTACRTCYRPTKEQLVKAKQDSIDNAIKQKKINDSIANINKIRIDSIRPSCYDMPAPKNDKPKKK